MEVGRIVEVERTFMITNKGPDCNKCDCGLIECISVNCIGVHYKELEEVKEDKGEEKNVYCNL